MGLTSTPPETHQLPAAAVDTLRVRKSRMQSSSKAFLFSMLVVLVLAAFIPSKVEAQEFRPILMNRRDLLPYGDIVSELKGKTLGGRMRFGKRSMGPYQPIPFETLEAYDRQQQA
ncbi:unnamed protein product [Cylicocyclus nassatus]|uniref:Uncharacterized protein n=1 Tax=Cylicocyclus nassatus TaxID=53992 RepID=A0AA36H689_CYLNA|nr:unnamed protein product [Cylicocyclus nassatus]